MALHRVRKGLDLPITGEPKQDDIRAGAQVSHVAVVGHDYPTMKPRMHVKEGDFVKRGQLLFEDRKSEGIRFTAPGAGKVTAIHRGERRVFQSLVIELGKSEISAASTQEEVSYSSYSKGPVRAVTGEKARALLAESGLWTAIRQRPFSRIPSPSETCQAFFVTATDTNPLAPSVAKVMEGQEEVFLDGLRIVSTLTEGPVYLCVGSDWTLDVRDIDRVQTEIFVGPHPSGLVGTHIHTLAPASRKRTVWHANYQDVIAIGHLFRTGKLNVERVISIAGPVVKEPGLVRTRLGASTTELTNHALEEGENRIISGSVIFGNNATEGAFSFLHRYDHQLSCVAEDRERRFLGWLMPGYNMYSTVRAYLSRWLPIPRKFAFTTTTHGSHRAMVPIGMFEKVMPLDIMPTFLLRSILSSDLERAEQLGCLELHEEDLALCSFVSPGKEDYGKALRTVLTEIWQEG